MGLLVDRYGWQSVFFVSGVVGIVAMALGLPRMRETRDPDATKLDGAGIASFTAMLTLLTFGVIQGPSFGWSSYGILATFAGAAVMAMSFVVIETRASRPMLDLTLFRYPRFVGVQLLPIATCCTYVVFLILLPHRFIGVEGLSEIDAGVLMLAISAPMLVVPYAAAHAARWISPGVLSAIGLLLAATGVFWLGQISLSSADATAATQLATALPVVPPMLLIGLGVGIPWGLMDGLSVTVVPKERAGMASGIFNTSKVASEGIILAMATAALGSLTAHNAYNMVLESVDQSLLFDAAQRAVTGTLSRTGRPLLEVDSIMLIESYHSAFRTLSTSLAAITAGISFVVLLLLRRSKN